MPDRLWSERLAPLLERPRLGVFSDLDGTLSPIAATPERAVVEPGCVAALRRLAGLLPRVGIISGRAAADARARVGLPELVYVGNHGLERVIGDEVVVEREALPWVEAITRAGAELARLELPPGVRLEGKRLTLSVHYRLAAESADIGGLAIALRQVARRHGLELTAGKKLFEMRPAVAIDKGVALTRLVREAALDAVLYLGDDWTDLDAFRAVGELRAAGVPGVAVAVLGADAPAEVYERAELTVAGPAEAGELLAWVADRRTERAAGATPAATPSPG